MLDAIITSNIIYFQDDITQNGLYVNYGYGNKFLISIISMNAANTVKRNDSMTVFDSKRHTSVISSKRFYGLCQITLQIITKDGNLVIGFSFEEL